MNKLFLALPILLTGCVAPLIVGGTTAVGTMAVKEKGIGGTLSDTEISFRIKKKYYSFDPDLYSHVGLNVENGDVLLTGSVPNKLWIQKAEELALKVYGVKSVLNNVTLMKDPNSICEKVSSLPSDSWITTQLKTKLLIEDNVNSLNYSVKTVDNVLYIMGVAKSQGELDKVIELASSIANVKKIVNTVKIVEAAEDEKSLPQSQSQDQSQDRPGEHLDDSNNDDEPHNA